jgi:NAD-dependent deacetylase
MVVLSIGTSSVVYPAASLPFEALRTGATVVEVNAQPTPLTARANYVLAGAAGVILRELAARVREMRRA